MDATEALVAQHLASRGFTDVVYEPDGNIPPDFVVNGSIAIEVRRLNQSHDDGSGSGPRGLEETSIPFWKFVKRHLEQLSGPSSESWWVFFSYGRPLPKLKVVGKELDGLLKPFALAAHRKPFEHTLPCGIRVRVAKASLPKATFFRHGGGSDDQAGGWVLHELEKNLNLWIAEKTRKVAPYRHKYPIWWLAFTDHIGWGLDDFDQELFRDQVQIKHTFDKVILIDPGNPARSFEVDRSHL